MKTPALDTRSLDALRQELKALAACYTPEWRFEGTQDDPGAALAELFCRMFEQTVDRMNSVPEKLYTEFLNLIGFRLPAPASAAGSLPPMKPWKSRCACRRARRCLRRTIRVTISFMKPNA